MILLLNAPLRFMRLVRTKRAPSVGGWFIATPRSPMSDRGLLVRRSFSGEEVVRDVADDRWFVVADVREVELVPGSGGYDVEAHADAGAGGVCGHVLKMGHEQRVELEALQAHVVDDLDFRPGE